MTAGLVAVPDPEDYRDDEEASARSVEAAVIGAVFLSGGTRQREIMALVEDDDFSDPVCRWFARQLREMLASGHPVDALTFPGWLHRNGRVPQPAQRRELRVQIHAMESECPAAVMGPWYAAQVVELSARRAVRDAGARIAELAQGADIRELREALAFEFRLAAEKLDRAIAPFDV